MTDITFSDRITAARHGISREEARVRRIAARVSIGWDDLGSDVRFAAVRAAFADRDDLPYGWEEEGIDLENDGGATFYYSFHDSWDPDAPATHREAYVDPADVEQCIPHTLYDDMVMEDVLLRAAFG